MHRIESKSKKSKMPMRDSVSGFERDICAPSLNKEYAIKISIDGKKCI